VPPTEQISRCGEAAFLKACLFAIGWHTRSLTHAKVLSRITCGFRSIIYNQAVKEILDIEVPCLVSGLTLNGKVCDFHKVPLIRLDNGSIMAYCPNHRSRSFIADRTTCFLISKVAKVVDRISQPLKEPKHGPT